LEEAVRIQSAPGGVQADLAVSLGELANANFYVGRLDTSESLNQRALAIDRQLYGDRHPNVAEDLINLGAIESERGHYPETEHYYRQALDILQKFFGPDNPETADVMMLVARTLNAQGRFNDAASMLQGALSALE